MATLYFSLHSWSCTLYQYIHSRNYWYVILKCTLLISSNPLARISVLPRIPPENFKSIGQSTGLKCDYPSAHALASVTGPFDVNDVSNSYNVFWPLVFHLDYQWQEIFDLRGCNSVMGGLIDHKFSGGILGSKGILVRRILEMCKSLRV